MFTIGDFARHGRVSVRMLRNYDATGLLRPARVDPASGYRFYEGRPARAAQPHHRAEKPRLHSGPGARHAGRARQQLHGILRLRQAELQSAIAADTSRLAQVEARLRIIELEGAMPVDDIQVKRIPAVRVAELTATAARLEPASINPVIQPLYRELGERLGQAGLTPAGPATSYYEDAPDGDGVIVHAALPVNADPGSAHGFEITDLPEITQAATIMHRGPMDNVMATIQTLARWIDENGYRSSGHVRELTLECPDDPDKWVTELQEPITPA
jgi:effector-binding domain-containing protein